MGERDHPGPCAYCGWSAHHPIDCPEYVPPPGGEPWAWVMLYDNGLVPEVSADGQTVTMRRRTLLDRVRPSAN